MLTDKNKRFVDEYLIDLNATQAAIRAGYSKKTARSIGQRLLTNVDVQPYLEQKQKELQEKTKISTEWVLKTLVENCEKSMQAVAVLDHEGEPTGEYRYEPSAVNRALELIGKHLGMFKEKIEMTGKDGKPLEVASTITVYIPDNGRNDKN